MTLKFQQKLELEMLELVNKLIVSLDLGFIQMLLEMFTYIKSKII